MNRVPGGVLIVSASTGTGHARAAEAIREAFAVRAPEIEVEHIDLLSLAPRWVRAAYGGGYEFLASHAPWLWREVYRWTDAPKEDSARWGRLAHRVLFREFRRLLLERPWSLCLCTHFLPCQLAAGRRGLPPFALAITDFTLHRYWAQPQVNRYFVATDALAGDVRRRLPGARVDATGIPVAPEFAGVGGVAECRASLGLHPHRPVALVMGGGMGLGVQDAALAAAAARVRDLQVVAVCGRNGAAATELTAAGLPVDRLRVHGFVPDIARAMAAADVIVTKPGGLTCSEALAVGRPLILTRPVPGQEEGNTTVLVGAGAALAAPRPESVTRAVEHIFHEPGLLLRLASSARAAGRPDAAPAIVHAALGELHAVSAA